MRKVINKEEGFEEFFTKEGFEVEEDLSKNSKLKGFATFGAFSIVFGLVTSLLILSSASIGMYAATPVIDYWKSLPSELDDVSIAERNVLLDKNGAVFAEVWAQNRISIDSLDKVSNYAIRGLIDTEDQRFYEHAGFDFIGTLRSAVNGSGGGSGITQQLVKNLQFYNQAGTAESKKLAVEHSVERKIKELKLAIEYEKSHSKDEILTSYFNTVAFGAPNIYSIEAASQYFFDKPAKDLDLAQASALVGTAQNASLYNMDDPTNTAWKNRQKEVLGRMLSEGDITQEEYDSASTEELTLVKKKTNGSCSSSKYPFYCEYVMDYLQNSEKLGETSEERSAIIAKGGLRIQTYLDPAAMDSANDYLKRAYGTTNRAVAPTAIVQPGTGGVEAIAFNRDYGQGEGKTEINVANTKSAVGSVYKMFTLAAALNNGMSESDLAFSSRCPLIAPGYDYPKGGFVNSESCALQGGYMDYKKATALSSNTWFVELEIKVGVDKIKEFSKSVGLETPDSITNRSLSFTLGSVEDSPIQMAAAFATFANDGIFCPATPVASYTYEDGSSPEIPDTYDPSSNGCKRVMSAKSAGVVLKAMRANIDGSVPGATGIGKSIPGHDNVGKTGTNELYNSTWAQMTKDHSLFINLYDMDKLTNGMDYVRYFGVSRRWYDHTSAEAGFNILKNIVGNSPNKTLDFDSTDTSMEQIQTDNREFMTIPSVVGMSPEEALSSLKGVGISAYVSKETRPKPEDYPSGVIVEQSIAAGEKLAVGTKKEIILYIGE